MGKLKNRSANSRKTRGIPEAGNAPGGIDWRLPSGEGLLEFAFRGGFLAPPMLGSVGDRLKQRFRRTL